MGSPIDARLSPTVTNKLAEERPFAWFQSQHDPHRAAALSGRGAARLSGLRPALQLHVDERREAPGGAPALLRTTWWTATATRADKHLEFYDEYLSVLDLTEEFYLQTVDVVFQRYLLPQGRAGASRPPGAARARSPTSRLMTVEGENDDISGVGQTQAAHGLCSSLPDGMKAGLRPARRRPLRRLQRRAVPRGDLSAGARDDLGGRVALAREPANAAPPRRIKAA